MDHSGSLGDESGGVASGASQHAIYLIHREGRERVRGAVDQADNPCPIDHHDAALLDEAERTREPERVVQAVLRVSE